MRSAIECYQDLNSAARTDPLIPEVGKELHAQAEEHNIPRDTYRICTLRVFTYDVKPNQWEHKGTQRHTRDLAVNTAWRSPVKEFIVCRIWQQEKEKVPKQIAYWIIYHDGSMMQQQIAIGKKFWMKILCYKRVRIVQQNGKETVFILKFYSSSWNLQWRL